MKKSKETKKEIESRISELKSEVQALQNQSGPQPGLRDKLKELMYWRRRRTLLGGKKKNVEDSD